MRFNKKIIQATYSRLHTLKTNFIVSTTAQPLRNNRGEGFLDVAMKVLIVVLIGGVVLGVLNAAVPGLFTSLIARITSELTVG